MRETKPNAFERALEEFEDKIRSQGAERKTVHAHTAWQSNPIGWMEKYLKIAKETILWSGYGGAYLTHEWDGTREPLGTVLQALVDWKDVGVEAGTGTNKTYTAAAIVLWFLACFEGAYVLTLAPKEKQLKLHLWKEIGRLWPRFHEHFPLAEKLGLQIRMRPLDDSWTAVGFTAGVGAEEEAATRAAGFHAEHMLFITEETPGIHMAVMNAIENTRTAPHNLHLALGNPDHQQDELHKFCIKPTTVHVRISALDHPNLVLKDPNIIPGAASVVSVKKRGQNYGEASRLYISRVRGICPAEDAESLIAWSWCVAARDREPSEVETGAGAMGVDVANSPNGDKASIAYGEGARLLEVLSWACPDSNAFGRNQVVTLMKQYKVDQSRVGVDNIGVGAGTVNELFRLGYMIQSLMGSASAIMSEDEEEFFNLRSQMWWQMRLDLQHGLIVLPDDEELFQDLTTPKWKPRNGRIWIESKEDLKGRLRRSPDKGDAAVYWNWIRKTRVEATIGGEMFDL